jgi:hypothetical protein
MRLRSAAAALLFCIACAAQNSLTADQLVAFVKSSIEQHLTDAEISRYLKSVKLTRRLSDSQFESLLTIGLGPRSLQALHAIHDQAQTQSLPSAEPAAKPAVPSAPAPSPQEQAAILAALRESALNYTRSLPNFLCAQQIRRKAAGEGDAAYRDQDTLLVRLSYFEQKEDYRLIMVNDRPANGTFQELGGSTSTGEFGTMLRQVFEPASHTKFEWTRWTQWQSRPAMIFRYAVEQANSRWELDYLRREHLVPGYSGYLVIDKESLAILRVTQRADNIPASFPIQAAETVLDYDYREIGGRQFLLPVRAQMDMTSDGTRTRNETDFRNYQKYSADAVITFK